MWVWMIIGATVVAALLSMHGHWDTRRDLRSGRPSYLSIVDYTGISRAETITELLGECDEEQRFTFSPEDLARLPRLWWMLFIDDLRTDVLLIAAAVSGGVLHERHFSAGLPLVIVSAIWILLSYVVAAWTVLQHPRLRE